MWYGYGSQEAHGAMLPFRRWGGPGRRPGWSPGGARRRDRGSSGERQRTRRRHGAGTAATAAGGAAGPGGRAALVWGRGGAPAAEKFCRAALSGGAARAGRAEGGTLAGPLAGHHGQRPGAEGVYERTAQGP